MREEKKNCLCLLLAPRSGRGPSHKVLHWSSIEALTEKPNENRVVFISPEWRLPNSWASPVGHCRWLCLPSAQLDSSYLDMIKGK